jgi:hypothetical protein
MRKIARVDKYAYYNKVLLARPTINTVQSLLFISSIEILNEFGRFVPNVYKRYVDIVYVDKLRDCYVYQIEYLEADFDIKGDARRDTNFIKAISYVFDELLVKVSFDGHIIEVLNNDTIALRWEQTKQQLYEENDGEEFEAYCENMETFIKNEMALIDYLNLPTMYGCYFNGYWRQYFYEKQYSVKIVCGIKLNNITIEENIGLKKVEREDDAQLVEITGSLIETELSKENNILFSATYAKYYNGFLDCFERVIRTPEKNITYNIDWLGLKPNTEI